jgi:hypothetical protein
MSFDPFIELYDKLWGLLETIVGPTPYYVKVGISLIFLFVGGLISLLRAWAIFRKYILGYTELTEARAKAIVREEFAHISRPDLQSKLTKPDDMKDAFRKAGPPVEFVGREKERKKLRDFSESG